MQGNHRQWIFRLWGLLSAPGQNPLCRTTKQNPHNQTVETFSSSPVSSDRMQPPRRLILALTVLFTILISQPAVANGGQVRVANHPIGPYEVTVFTSPVPLQTGTVDVSVLLQRREDKAIVENAEIILTITPLNGGSSQKYPVTREQATNKLYYAAEFSIDQPGAYRIELAVRAPEGAGSVAFDVTVERATSSLWRSWWLWGAVAVTTIPLLWWLFGGGSRNTRTTSSTQARKGRP
uniref:YtkA-like domain-containing protein n=1 Tax=Thermomicrobium roseum TaxID=500 RepID=A0A7C1FSI3_THERO